MSKPVKNLITEDYKRRFEGREEPGDVRVTYRDIIKMQRGN